MNKDYNDMRNQRPRYGSSGNGHHSSSFSNGSSNYSNGYQKSNGNGFSSYNKKSGNSAGDDIQLRKPNWSTMQLKPFEKNFYREHETVKNRPNNVLLKFLNENNIVVSGDKFINPIMEFDEAGFPDRIVNKVKELNFKQPTIIQSMCWPILLSGHDIVAIAQTGSGKTLGFVLPVMIHIKNQPVRHSHDRNDTNGPLALILAPTRELVQQIQSVIDSFANVIGINSICVYGGSPKQPQLQQIRRGGEVVIATPGRLLDFLKDNSIKLSNCQYLVLDEADRMLDMGFEPQIRKIIEQIRPDRQTCMFSATWPKEVRKLAEDFLLTYMHITIGNADSLTVNPNITQIVEVCEEDDKRQRITEILANIMKSYDAKVIMFAETKRKVDDYSKFIRSLGHYCLTIHGDKKQSERDWVLNEFRERKKSILVATDVAARGLNIEDVKFVINIDYPTQTEDYIHRIGRTARSTKTGTAFTFITSENNRHVPKLIELLRDTNQEISPRLLDMYDSMRKPNGRYMSRGNMGNRNGGGASRFGSYNNSNGHSNGNSNGYGGGNSSNGNANGNNYNKGYNKSNGDASRFNGNSDTDGYRKRHLNDTDSDADRKRVKKCRWDDPSGSQPANGSNSYDRNSTAGLMDKPIAPVNNNASQNAYFPVLPPHLQHMYQSVYYNQMQAPPPPPPAASTQPPPPPPPPTASAGGYEASWDY